jgi:hypothetical protein
MRQILYGSLSRWEKRHLKTGANRRVLRVKKDTGCQQLQSLTAVIESRVPLVVLFFDSENFAAP